MAYNERAWVFQTLCFNFAGTAMLSIKGGVHFINNPLWFMSNYASLKVG